MIHNSLVLPRKIWITAPLFNETLVQPATLLEVTYDKFGAKQCVFQTKNGTYIWDRAHQSSTNIFEDLQEAVNSVASGNYSILQE